MSLILTSLHTLGTVCTSCLHVCCELWLRPSPLQSWIKYNLTYIEFWLPGFCEACNIWVKQETRTYFRTDDTKTSSQMFVNAVMMFVWCPAEILSPGHGGKPIPCTCNPRVTSKHTPALVRLTAWRTIAAAADAEPQPPGQEGLRCQPDQAQLKTCCS